MRWKPGKDSNGDATDDYIESTEGYRVCVMWQAGVKWFIAFTPEKNKQRERLGQQLNDKAARALCTHHARPDKLPVSNEQTAHEWCDKIKQEIDGK